MPLLTMRPIDAPCHDIVSMLSTPRSSPFTSIPSGPISILPLSSPENLAW